VSKRSSKPSEALLDPIERISEILFGLIMVLTVTCSFSVAEGQQDVRAMLFAALGCNLAWGVIDAVFYLMIRFSEQGHGILALRLLRQTSEPSEAQAIIGRVLPPFLTSALTPVEFELIHRRLNGLSEPPTYPRLVKTDWLAALGVFSLVFLSTLPVVIPFVFIGEAKRALRVSNGIAILTLFIAGRALGKHAGRRPLLTGIVMVIVGTALVAITVGLGG
jgi:hypothetical protein